MTGRRTRGTPSNTEPESSTSARPPLDDAELEDLGDDEPVTRRPSRRLAARATRPEPQISEEDDDDEALEKEYQELQAQLKRQRRRAEIQAMRDERDGKEPERYVEIEGTSLPTRKRPLSASATQGMDYLNKYAKTSTPVLFDGKSPKQLREYTLYWEREWATIPPHVDVPDALRIAAAAKSLRERAAFFWGEDRKKEVPYPETWQDYIAWCKGTIGNADVLKSTALEQLAGLKQGRNESVKELVQRISMFEDDVGELSRDEREGWVLFNSLSDDLQNEVRLDIK